MTWNLTWKERELFEMLMEFASEAVGEKYNDGTNPDDALSTFMDRITDAYVDDDEIKGRQMQFSSYHCIRKSLEAKILMPKGRDRRGEFD